MPPRKRTTRKDAAPSQKIPPRRKNFKMATKDKRLRKSLTYSQSRLKQIQTLKSNNKSLAAALDEARKDSRDLHDSYVALQEERQALMERVASLEGDSGRRVSIEPAIRFLDKAQRNIQCAKENLICVSLGQCPSSEWTGPRLSPINSCPSNRRVHFETASSDTNPSHLHSAAQTGTLSYPKTPYPPRLCRVDARQVQQQEIFNSLEAPAWCKATRPQYVSTPFVNQSETVVMELTPCVHAIHFSAGEESGASQTQAEKGAGVSPTEGNQPVIEGDSPGLPEAGELETQGKNEEDMSELRRPKRKCSSFSVSYQEPSLHKKLRRGDRFTETLNDWSRPDQRRKRIKRSTKYVTAGALRGEPLTSTAKSAPGRKALQDLTNTAKL